MKNIIIKTGIVLIISSLLLISCEKDKSGELVYSNSFESAADTTGWKGYAFSFNDDTPLAGGKRSLLVSGGCILPHAEFRLAPASVDRNLIFYLWGRNLSNGGYFGMSVEGSGKPPVTVNVTSKDWTPCFSSDKLFCPAGSTVKIEASSGGFAASSMLIDLLEIRVIPE